MTDNYVLLDAKTPCAHNSNNVTQKQEFTVVHEIKLFDSDDIMVCFKTKNGQKAKTYHLILSTFTLKPTNL